MLYDPRLGDRTRVARQCRALACAEIPDLDGRVRRPAGQDPGIKMQMDHAVRVARQRANAFARVVIPDPECVVHGARHKLGVIKLECPDTPGMASQGTKYLASLEIPHRGRLVARARNQNVLRIAKLEAKYRVRMLQCLDLSEATLTPVTLHDQSLAVHAFPRLAVVVVVVLWAALRYYLIIIIILSWSFL